MKVGLKQKQDTKGIKLNKMKIFEKAKQIPVQQSQQQNHQEDTVSLFDEVAFDILQPEPINRDNVKSVESNSIAAQEKVMDTLVEDTKVHGYAEEETSEDLDFIIDAEVLFSESVLFQEGEEPLDMETDVDMTESFLDVEVETVSLEIDASSSENHVLNDAIVEDVIIEEPLEVKEETPYKRVVGSTDNYITDEEFEALMDIFSNMTKEEVEALPDNYKKIFYQNFEENDAYLDEETNATIHEKLKLKITPIKETFAIPKEEELQQILACNYVVDKISIKPELFTKIMNNPTYSIMKPAEYNAIKAKLNTHVTYNPQEDDQVFEDTSDEDITVVVYYQNDDVPEALLLEEGLIGLKPYKVYDHSQLKMCNRNFEIPLKKGEQITIDTGLCYVADANCKVSILSGINMDDLLLVSSCNKEGNLCLNYTVLDDTYISKSSIIGCLKY